MIATLQLARGEVAVDLSRPINLAMPIDFAGNSARHFGAPAPRAQPLTMPGFLGSVAAGAGCNCSTITLTPHCNGTHTECAAHLTRDALDVHTIIPPGLIPTLMLTIEPIGAAVTRESTVPTPQEGDWLITAQAIERGWLLNGQLDPSLDSLFEPRALVVRTEEVDSAVPPYFSREAMELLVERGIEHLVVDLPSIDRTQDEGKLTAHRVFFGLPSQSQSLVEATRQRATVTELARIPEHVADGWYFLELQAPALAGDAVPSRPLLYPVLSS